MSHQFTIDLQQPSDTDQSCRRRFGRRYQQGLQSDLGLVTDLSAGGMKVVTNRVPEEELEVSLLSLEGTLTVRARVAWSKRTGFTRHTIGLEFVDLDDETRSTLTRISSAHRIINSDAA